MAKTNLSDQQLELWPREKRILGRSDFYTIQEYWLGRIRPVPCVIWLSRLCLTYGEARMKAAIDRTLELAFEARDRGKGLTGEMLMQFCRVALGQSRGPDRQGAGPGPAVRRRRGLEAAGGPSRGDAEVVIGATDVMLRPLSLFLTI